MADCTSPSTLERGESFSALAASNSISPSALERGDSFATLVDGGSNEPSGTSGNDTTTDSQGGFAGLASLMAHDPQYNMHPCFETATTELLLRSEWDIKKLIGRLQIVQTKVKVQRNTKGKSSEKSRAARQEKRLAKELKSELVTYYDLFIRLGKVVRYGEPNGKSIDGLKNWTSESFPDWHDLFGETMEADEMRSVWPRQSQIENLVMGLPTKRFGQVLCYPFLKKKQIVGGVQVRIYNYLAFFTTQYSQLEKHKELKEQV
ncbi:hypothetical protein B0T17DRAFT_619584 [Bombardia bombarda]|uniref:DUF6594 domain-containing protein n=1 Tax=Bombardia bombarda TaxID=252184 RepID=A0AA40BWC2_9PEZI|nr:hypothetical protein B0T17DRAFT_619584 [Bombardia bombarda]